MLQRRRRSRVSTMNLSPEEKKIGKENFDEAVGTTRRDFLKGTVLAAGPASAAPGAWPARPGLMQVYDWKTEDQAREHVKVYGRYQDLLDDPDLDIEAVIIA